MTEEKPSQQGDEEIDIARAIELTRAFVKDNVGNLVLHEFRIESVRQNGSKTLYIVICSIIPDLGEDREYYLIKVDVKSGKLVLPIGRGKKTDGKLHLEEIEVDQKWVE